MGTEILDRMVRGSLNGMTLFGWIPEGGGGVIVWGPGGIAFQTNEIAYEIELSQENSWHSVNEWGDRRESQSHASEEHQCRWPWRPPSEPSVHPNPKAQPWPWTPAFLMCFYSCTDQISRLLIYKCIFRLALVLLRCPPTCFLCCHFPGSVPFRVLPGKFQGGETASFSFLPSSMWALSIPW